MLTNKEKVDLDRYITSEPEDNFTPWVEMVFNEFSDEFYKEAYEDRTDFENSKAENDWLNKLYDRQEYEDYEDDDGGEGNVTKIFGDITPEKAARIIEPAYKILIRNKL